MGFCRLRIRSGSWMSLLMLWLSLCGCGGPGDEVAGLSDEDKRAAIEATYEGFRGSFRGVMEVSAEEVAALRREAGAVVVDVRTDDERAVSVIQGSLSRKEFRRRLDEFREVPVVLQCTVGYRSGEYAMTLLDEGLDARNLRGGILAWVHAGLPVVDSSGMETRRVHVYGPDWDLLPEGFTAVW